MIINDMLDLSKIEVGKLDLELSDFDLAVALEEACELVAFKAESKGVDFVLRIAPGGPRMVTGDPGRIRQIVLNLLTNAVKFTEHGHVFVDVRTIAQTGSRATISISVEDTGVGISPEQQARLFQDYGQADASTARRYGGPAGGRVGSKGPRGPAGRRGGRLGGRRRGSTFE